MINIEKIAIGFIALLLLSLSGCQEKKHYLFSYFTNNGEDGLHMAYSQDGVKWVPINDGESLLAPQIGPDSLMRDPCIIRGGDGNYHMVWTVSWTQRGVGYASSPDCVNWSEQKMIPVMMHEPNARNCWAPEITYDPKNDQYMIYWATTIEGLINDSTQQSEDKYNHRMYYTLTKDFVSFSPTALLYDKGFNVIDATIQPLGDRWVMFLKDETLVPVQKNLRIAYADQLIGPWSEPSAPITGNYWAEGPTALYHDGAWIVYFDKYKEGKYGALRSKDLKEWEEISDQIVLPDGIRHGTIVEVPESTVKQLRSSYPF